VDSEIDQKKLYYKPYQTQSLGCLNCVDSDVCGGNQSSPGIFDCQIFCQCDEPSECTNVCPKNENYIARVQEVRGFTLSNIPRSKIIRYSVLPLVSPVVYHKYSRKENLAVEAVTIPLRLLFNQSNGSIEFQSKKEVAEHFRFDENAKLIIVGADDDKYIENYWSHRRSSKFPEKLAQLQPDLITSPNYSLPLNVVRQDNLYNIKRIAVAWHELVAEGIPTSLHVNGRTNKDWENWTDFIGEREEVKCISFEFATGGAIFEQGEYYAKNLIKLARIVGRDLRLVIRGGQKYVAPLNRAFSDLVFLDSTTFMKTVYRRALNWHPGDVLTDYKSKTKKNEPLDFLFQRNLKTMTEMIEFYATGRNSTKSLVAETGRYS
jgi:hypothetical protein